MYKCICGKEFEKVQALHGHQSHCKINLGEERLSQKKSLDEYKIQKMVEGTKKRCASIKQSKIELWISEKHTCEKCGKVMTEKYASGRFCSKSCSKSFSALSNNDQRKSNLSKSLVKAIEEGRHRPTFTSSHGNYIERYWSFILSNTYNLNVEKQHRVSKEIFDNNNHFYYLDILVEGFIDLEIDGPYHDVKRDAIRDAYLMKNGYIVYRVDYINPRKEKDKVLKQIEDFVNWIKNEYPLLIKN